MNPIKTITLKGFDVEKIRSDFPLLSKKVNGKTLIYFDNASTAQKPKNVIDTVTRFYETQNANIHRGVHTLSQLATIAYEDARSTIQTHLNAKYSREIIFTKGATDSINLLANSFGKKFISKGDEIIISEMEHHSNILPWQQLCEDGGAVLKIIPINEEGELNLEKFEKLLSNKTKIVAVTHISNTLGTINDIEKIIKMAHKFNVPVLIDGAQAVPHSKIDVQSLDCDFYCFSGHKLFGPTGIGVLYGKEKWLNLLPPYQVGGGTIKTVSFKKTEYANAPLKFEAGTPNIEGALGLAAAIDYVNKIELQNIASHETELLDYATLLLEEISDVKIIGTAKNKASVISFIVKDMHPFDIGTLLDQFGIAIRTGHHCTQPLMEHYGIQGTMRASFSFYNTKQEIAEFIIGLNKSIKMLK